MSESQQPTPTPDDCESLVLTAPDASSSPKDFILWAGVIVLALLTVYAPALRGRFLWDDDRHVELNRNLRDGDGLINIWTKIGPRAGGTIQYYPLTHTTFWIEYQLSGASPGQIPTMIFHVTNVLLHAAAAILLWFVLRELFVPGAWLIAAIFALHPIEVESVAWISERKNVLAGAFFFGSILAYLRSDEFRAKERPAAPDQMYWLSLALFAAALLSKSMSAPLVGVLLVIIWWKRGRVTGRDLLLLAPYFVLAIAMSIVTSWIEHTQVGARGPEWDLSLPQRILIAGRAVWFYAAKLIWPTKLAFIYPRWDVDPAQIPQWLFPLGVIVVLVALFLARKRIGRGALAAALIFVGTLVPAMGFINFYPMRYSFVADHFQYFAGPALIALIVASIATWLRRVKPDITSTPLPYILGAVVLIPIAILTALQSQAYASHKTLWQHVISKNPGAWMAQYNLASALNNEATTLPPDRADESRKLMEEAIPHLQKATELRPDHDRAFALWGQLLLVQGKADDAFAKAQQAIAINPGNFDALTTRALALSALNRPAEAKSAYETAIAVAATQPSASPQRIAVIRQTLAQMAVDAGDVKGAIDHFKEGLKAAPRSATLHREYARLLAKYDDRNGAALHYQLATNLAPQDIDAHVEFANLMMEAGNLGGAATRLTEATGFAGDISMRTGVPPPMKLLNAEVELANRMMKAGDLNSARTLLAAATAIAGEINRLTGEKPPQTLQDAIKRWSDQYEATTRPSTTRSTTRSSTTRAATQSSTTRAAP